MRHHQYCLVDMPLEQGIKLHSMDQSIGIWTMEHRDPATADTMKLSTPRDLHDVSMSSTETGDVRFVVEVRI